MGLLSNLIVGDYRFVLFLDKIGFKQDTTDVMASFLREHNEHQIITDLVNMNEISLSVDKGRISLSALPKEMSTVVLPPARTLFDNFLATDIFQTIHKLKTTSTVKQVFLWLCRKHFSEDDHLPAFVEHMANAVVTLHSGTELELLLRKTGGKVTRRNYVYQLKDGLPISICEVAKKSESMEEAPPKVTPDALATFKTGLSEVDLIARSNLVLPFERHLKVREDCPATGGSIVYHPDKADDFDEEDPDDDLDV